MHRCYVELIFIYFNWFQYWCADVQVHGTTKLVPYFTVMNYCLVSRTEKLMVSDTVVNYHVFIGICRLYLAHQLLYHCHYVSPHNMRTHCLISNKKHGDNLRLVHHQLIWHWGLYGAKCIAAQITGLEWLADVTATMSSWWDEDDVRFFVSFECLLSEETTSAQSLTSFRQHLKTWLFRQSYPDLIIWSVLHW